MAFTLVVFCGAIVSASFLGGLLPLLVVLTHTRLQIYLSFAAGAMLGAAFFHMLPEAVELGDAESLRWSAVGLLALFFLERYFAYHRHESPEDPHHHHHHHHGEEPDRPWDSSTIQWGAAAFGLAIHTLAGGVALASAAATDQRGLGAASWGVFLATLVHKPADALTIVSLMIRSGTRRPIAHLVNLGFALMIPAGVLLFFLGRSWFAPHGGGAFTAATLAFSAGTFLCIALSDLLPELHFHAHDRLKLSVALLAGFGLMLLAGLWE